MSFYSIIYFSIFLFFFQSQVEFVKFEKERVQIKSFEEKIEVDLFFSIEPGYHIQAYDEVPDHIIPTTISFTNSDQNYKLKSEFVIHVYDTIILDKTPLRVISDEFQVKVFLEPLNLNSEASKLLKGSLNYQACDDRQCFFPREVKFEVSL